MDSEDVDVRAFLERCLAAGDALDIPEIDALYAETFMFARPEGARAVAKEAFLSALPGRREFFESVGFHGSELVSFENEALDSHYLLVRSRIRMRFKNTRGEMIQPEFDTVYILHVADDSPRIVLHMESEYLEAAMQELGLLEK